MDEWNFKRVGIEDQKLIEEYFRKYPERSCDRTFFGVLLWGRHYNLKFADTGKALLFREEDERGYGFAWPAGPEEEIRELIPQMEMYCEKHGGEFLMYGLSEAQFALLDSWYPGRYQIEYDRDAADYIYESEKLCTLSGKKLHGKPIISISSKLPMKTGLMNHLKRIIWRNVFRWRSSGETKTDVKMTRRKTVRCA